MIISFAQLLNYHYNIFIRFTAYLFTYRSPSPLPQRLPQICSVCACVTISPELSQCPACSLCGLHHITLVSRPILISFSFILTLMWIRFQKSSCRSQSMKVLDFISLLPPDHVQILGFADFHTFWHFLSISYFLLLTWQRRPSSHNILLSPKSSFYSGFYSQTVFLLVDP